MGKGANIRPSSVGASSTERIYLSPLSVVRRIFYLVAFLVGCALISFAGLQLVTLAIT